MSKKIIFQKQYTPELSGYLRLVSFITNTYFKFSWLILIVKKEKMENCMLSNLENIQFEDFLKVDIRAGTIIEAKLNPPSEKTSLYLKD